MYSSNSEISERRYTVNEPRPHTLHECGTADEFCVAFERAASIGVAQIAGDVVAPGTPLAIFLVGSIPLGMATSGSDIDLIALVDNRAALRAIEHNSANNDQRLEYASEGDTLLAGMFANLRAGILVDLQVAITPTIRRIHTSLRRRGPELSDSEVRTLGRLSTGWLLWQSDAYLERNCVALKDPALDVYCCTKSFVSALIHRRKAGKALDLGEVQLALHLGRSAVEMAYLAYFASDGIPYVGAKWLMLIGRTRDARERTTRHPLLRDGVQLLFPADDSIAAAAQFLSDVQIFLKSMRCLIEQKVLYKIAFSACPQIASA
jgi:hypothetical protein